MVTGLGCGEAFTMAGGPLLDQEFREVNDEQNVEHDHRCGQPGGAADQMFKLEWEVEARGDDSEPFGPVFAVPEAIAFGQPDDRIGEGQGGDLTDVVIRGPGDALDEQSHVMGFGVNAVAEQQSIRGGMQVSVAQGQEPARSR